MTYQGYLAVYDFKRKFTDRVSGFARADYDWTDYVFSRAAGFNPRTDVTGWRAGATVGANLELADWVTLEVSGRGEQREAVRYRSFSDAPSVTYAERNGNLTGRKVTEYSAAAQLDFDLFPFAVLAGARYTNNENAGSNFSPRATALWSFTTGQSLKLIAGQSYRAPTLFEQFFLNRAVNPSGYGNPEIKPETATSYEAAYVGQRGGLSWQALGYWAKYEDKIARQPVPDGTVLAGTVCTAGCTMYMNMPGYTAKGVEL
jgi:outer membrane receptor protein involved in Fe transport